jgi:protein ImuB
MRYAAALSLCGELRAASVPETEVRDAVDAVVEKLRRFTPAVEPSREDPGAFWLNAAGLGRLFGSASRWAASIQSFLGEEALEATVVVGFTRFAVSAVAKSGRGVTVFRSPAEETEALRRVPLERLDLPLRALEALHKLGVHSVGSFTALPAEGIQRRFGPAAWRLHREARGDLLVPLEPRPAQLPLERTTHLEHGERDLSRLMAAVEELLSELLAPLAPRGLTVAELCVRLGFEDRSERAERLRPAAPTTDLRQLAELVRLRLGSLSFPDTVNCVTLSVKAARGTHTQLEVFAAKPRRDLGAANRALARLRAELGEAAVVRAKLRDGHLPEARFEWEPLRNISAAPPASTVATASTVPTASAAAPRPAGPAVLVRRIFSRPLRLPARPRHEPDGWMLDGIDHGPVARVFGPYVVSGGWWRRPVHREYHFAETERGEILWAYYDRPRRRWFIQGRVE